MNDIPDDLINNFLSDLLDAFYIDKDSKKLIAFVRDPQGQFSLWASDKKKSLQTDKDNFIASVDDRTKSFDDQIAAVDAATNASVKP